MLHLYVGEQLAKIHFLHSPAPNSLAALIKSLLTLDAKMRWSPSQALKHDWYKKMSASTAGHLDRIWGYLREFMQAEQRARSTLSALSPQSLPLPHFNSFVERPAMQELLKKQLSSLSPSQYCRQAPILVCQGIAGAGKSQILTHLIHQKWIQDRFGLRLWFQSCDKPAMLASQCTALARELIDARVSEEEAMPRLHTYLADYPTYHGKPWLAVFDSAKDAASLAPYLPKAGGHILVATRSNSWKETISIDACTPTEAQSLVEKLLMRRPPGIADLCKELCYLPLAIVKACTYIRNHQLDIPAFMGQLHMCPTLLDHSARLFGKEVAGSPMSSWYMRRFAKLERLPPTAALCIQAFLSNPDGAVAARTSKTLHRVGKEAPLSLGCEEFKRVICALYPLRKGEAPLNFEQILKGLSANSSPLDHMEEGFARRFQNLQAIDLSRSAENIADIFPLLSRFPNLGKINLSRSKIITWIFFLDLKMSGLRTLGNYCPELKSLDLSFCNQITELSFLTLPKLTSLNLRNYQEFTDAGLEFLAKKYPNLQSLNLSGCKKITDQGISLLTLPELTDLNLIDCTGLTDAGLKTLATNCPKLKSLNHTVRKELTNAGFGSVLSFSVSKDLTNSGLEAIIRDWPRLQSLNFSGCYRLTDQGFSQLKLPELTSLDLSGCYIYGDDIAKNCPKLRSLNLSSCDYITDRGVALLMLPELTSLNFRHSKKLTDAGLKALAKNCPKLESLDLKYCKNITDAGLKALAKNCLELQSVDLKYCNKITARGRELWPDKSELLKGRLL